MKIKELINSIDDEYLIGISNKGIVKRAYKDIENSTITVISEIDNGDNIQVKVDDEETLIQSPLNESTCTCPSRSICKHRIMAIITIKKLIGREEDKENSKNNTNEIESELEDNSNGINSKELDLTSELTNELKEIDVHKITKVIPKSKFKKFIASIDNEENYDITYGLTITVKLKEYNNIVKLLYPLKDSACSCHKKELCMHKAIAILKYKYDNKLINKENLSELIEDKSDYDLELIKDTAKSVIKNIEEIMRIGLTRTPKDVMDNFDRTAILCHNAKLAKQENRARAISELYKAYFNKVLTFDIENLILNLKVLYEDMNKLLKEDSLINISKIAGEFRSDYLSVGNLNLAATAYEHYITQSGYECEKIYFLEKNNLTWYTLIKMIPVFYREDNTTSPVFGTPNMLNYNSWGKNSQDNLVWGLSETMKSLANCEIELTNAKCDAYNRLSQSKETKGSIIGDSKFDKNFLKGIYYESFDKLFIEHIEENELSVKNENVFIKPFDITKQHFDDKKQEFKLVVNDEKGYKITIMLKYDVYTKEMIKALKNIKPENGDIIFGKIYIKDGKLCLYPLNILNKRVFY